MPVVGKGGAAKAKLNTAPGAGGYMAKVQQQASQEAAARLAARRLLKRTPSERRKISEESGETVESGEEVDNRINIKRTLAKMEKWPGIVNGYIQLTAYTGFFLLYVFVITLQLGVQDVHQIDNMVRYNMLDQDVALSNVQQEGDVFAYLLSNFGLDGSFHPETEPYGGILGKLFASKWYNDDPYVPEEQGYLFDYNRLIGGIQIMQQRGKTTDCAGTSMYDGFYPLCYDSELLEAYPPTKKNSSGQVYEDYNDPAYVNASKATQYGQRSVLEDPNGPYATSILSSFEYDPNAKGYKVFLSLADGTERNLQKITNLRTMRWLDKGTRTLDIKFTFYNGNYRRFTFAKITLQFDQGGQFLLYDPGSAAVARIAVGGTTVDIASIKMEPYLVKEDFLLLGLEIVLMIWTFVYIVNFVRSLIVACVAKRLKAHLSSWMILDVANYICFIVYFSLRIKLMQHILDNVVEVPTSKYKVVFEQAFDMIRQQTQANFVNLLLLVLRFFKFYAFQPRLRIINTTLASSTVNMYHFLIIFFIIFVGFAAMGHVIFGGMYRDFYSLGNSLQVLFESLLGNFALGPTIGNSSLVYLDPYMGVIFFVTWIFTANMVLLNIFVAILMDSYAAAKEEGAAQAKRIGMMQPTAVDEDVSAFLSRMFKLVDSRSWKYSENTLRLALEHLDTLMPEPVDKTLIYEQELQKVEEQLEKLQQRKEELELLKDDPNEQPYHQAWFAKSVSINDIANVMPKVNRRFRTEKPDKEIMESVWDDTISYCPKETDQDQDAEEAVLDQLKEKLGRLIGENSALRSALGKFK